jgi:signal transduction histidine kinase/DNA-binding response OmpR family regulator
MQNNFTTGLNGSRRQNAVTWYYTLANAIIFIAVVLYILIRLWDAAQTENYVQVRLAATMGVSTILLVLIIQIPLKKFLDAAFFCPFILYIIFNAVVLMNHEGRYFFTVYLGTCCVATVYNNRRRLGQYLLVTNILNIVLVYFRIPLESAGQRAPYSELIVHEAVLIFASILLYLIVRFVTHQGSEAVRTTNTFNTLMNLTPMMIVIVDRLNCITHISRSLASFARVENPTLTLGRPVLDLFRNIDVKLMIGDMLISDEPIMSVKQIEINGKTRHFSIVSDKLGDNAGRYIYLDDVTIIDQARRDAEQATVAKSRFLATMSHEIRTPMNAIIGMSDLMPTENLSPLQKGYFEDIKKMARSLLTIINDSLDFSKIEAGKFDLVPIHYNIHALYDNIASMSEFIARGKSLEFRRSFDNTLPEILYGDEIRIRQILTNIANNAVKYTKNGYVAFSISRGRRQTVAGEAGAVGEEAAKDEVEYLIAEIADSGIGIKEDDIPKLFGSFQQLDVRKNREIVGTGLGLAITKELVSMMDGHIEVKSVYGFGTTFTVYLPLIPGDPGKVEGIDNMPVVRAKEGVRVLVVDDIPVNLTVALGFLVKHGIEAETAAGGYEAVEKVRESVESGRPYDIVFMDHMMPDLDGTVAAKQIRALGDSTSLYASLPIVALSANAVQGAEEVFLASGMNGFVSKPIEDAALNAALKKFLPDGTYILGTAGTEAIVKEHNPHEERIRRELSQIAGLNVTRGLHYAGESFETYATTLKQFSAGLEKGLAVIRESRDTGDWKAYTVQVHAYKGICAALGLQAVSDQGRELEAASKSDDKSLCLAETELFCSALADFNAALRRTSLFDETAGGEKTEVDGYIMATRLTELANACKEGRSARVKAAIKELQGTRLANSSAYSPADGSVAGPADGSPDFASNLEETLNMARSMDYDESAEKAGELIVGLANVGWSKG